MIQIRKAYDQTLSEAITDAYRSPVVYRLEIVRTVDPTIIKIEAFSRGGKMIPRLSVYWDLTGNERITQKEFTSRTRE